MYLMDEIRSTKWVEKAIIMMSNVERKDNQTEKIYIYIYLKFGFLGHRIIAKINGFRLRLSGITTP